MYIQCVFFMSLSYILSVCLVYNMNNNKITSSIKLKTTLEINWKLLCAREWGGFQNEFEVSFY